jgi:hypothetical protein
VRAALDRFVEAGRDIDACLADLVAASDAMRAALTEMHRLGCQFPSHEQLSTLGALALRTALMQAGPWSRYFERVGPTEAKTFGQLVEAWAITVENNIRPRLEQTTTPEAA